MPTGCFLERLDDALTRLVLAATRAQARQFVNRSCVLVDGKRVDVPFDESVIIGFYSR